MQISALPIDVIDIFPTQTSLQKLNPPLSTGVSLAQEQKRQERVQNSLTYPAVGIKGTVAHVFHREAQ